jgi:protein MPE1
MYIAGVGSAVVPTSESVQRQGGNVNSGSTWHKGAMSKRFDVKEDPVAASKPSSVRRQVGLVFLFGLLTLQ